MTIFDDIHDSILPAVKPVNPFDPGYLHFEEYRCAMVASKVYDLADLTDIDMPIVDEKELGAIFTDPNMVSGILHADESGIRCRIYHDLQGDKFIIGFGGTVPSKVDDWIDNFRQWRGLRSAQYERGVALAGNIRPKCRDKVIVTGHSLGGGIATVAALSGGIKGVVFNPPGIHRKTLADENIDGADELIQRFVVWGEILNQINHIPLQSILLPGSTQKILGSFTIPVARSAAIILAAARLLRHPALIASATAIAPLLQKSIDLHGMNEVFIGLTRYLSTK